MSEEKAKFPIISVVMSVYNGEQFLAWAIESILSQTFRDFEFIIVNDGSTDGSLAILNEYAQRDCRIRLISRENRGLTVSLNEGIADARGEWIARMDADDISLPDRFHKQMAWIQHTGADICGGWVQLTGTWFHRVWRYCGSSDAIRLKLLFGSTFAHPTVMLRTSVAKANPYNEKAHYVEDYELWTRLARLGVKMTNYPGVVLQYRIHPGQLTAIRQKQQRENMVHIFREYSASFLGVDLASAPSYLLIADKQLHVDEMEFYPALEFLSNLIKLHGDPEGVVSTTAFSFFARCGSIGPLKVMREVQRFHIRPFKKMVLLFLSSLNIKPGSRLYQLLYRIR